MIEPALDASALLAIILDEPGGKLDALLDHAVISTVNLTEVETKLLDLRRFDLDAVHGEFLRLVRVIDFTQEHAELAASLRPATKHAGLSLGDRACLALAISLGINAYTADRSWTQVEVGCSIHLVR